MKLLEISNNKAKSILYSLAKRFNGKPCIETNYRRYVAGSYHECTLVCSINGHIVCDDDNDPFYRNGINMWFSINELDFYKRNKYRFILTEIINTSLQGKDVILSFTGKAFVKRGTTFEQLLIETELAA